MIVIIDNYDSFIYNLARDVKELGFGVQIFRHDALTVDELAQLNPAAILMSPGPCTPNQAGISLDVVKCFAKTVPILGVCLGHQVIGQAYGGNIVRTIEPMHGKATYITHVQTNLFDGIENPMQVGLYHSLAIERSSLPPCLEVIATSSQGEIMAIKHRVHQVFGVQFHPESILTPSGKRLLKNFFTQCGLI